MTISFDEPIAGLPAQLGRVQPQLRFQHFAVVSNKTDLLTLIDVTVGSWPEKNDTSGIPLARPRRSFRGVFLHESWNHESSRFTELKYMYHTYNVMYIISMVHMYHMYHADITYTRIDTPYIPLQM
jgi:hypothetical protein